MVIQEHVFIKDYTTFKLDASVRYFCIIETKKDVQSFIDFAKEKELPYFILGGGSNVIIDDTKELELCVGLMKIEGIKTITEEDSVLVQSGAGVVWDDLVFFSVEHGYSGIEAMSAIPGSVGGTPVQNVGAYGQEIKDTLVSVEVFDTDENIFKNMTNEECHFSYRDSIFKKQKSKYIIISIVLRLSKKPASIPHYPGVEKYFQERSIQSPNLKEIRDAIIDIRWTKLPKPEVISSCGSFFKNPIVPPDVLESIKKDYPLVIAHPTTNHMYKIGAGWLIDQLGLKGTVHGNLSFYDKNALVISNNGNATKKELEALVFFVQSQAKEKFGIDLEPEPIFVSAR